MKTPRQPARPSSPLLQAATTELHERRLNWHETVNFDRSIEHATLIGPVGIDRMSRPEGAYGHDYSRFAPTDREMTLRATRGLVSPVPITRLLSYSHARDLIIRAYQGLPTPDDIPPLVAADGEIARKVAGRAVAESFGLPLWPGYVAALGNQGRTKDEPPAGWAITRVLWHAIIRRSDAWLVEVPRLRIGNDKARARCPGRSGDSGEHEVGWHEPVASSMPLDAHRSLRFLESIRGRRIYGCKWCGIDSLGAAHAGDVVLDGPRYVLILPRRINHGPEAYHAEDPRELLHMLDEPLFSAAVMALAQPGQQLQQQRRP